MYFSDVSKYAIEMTKLNCKLNKVNFNAKLSDLTNKWSQNYFDLIINDVSAISSFFLEKNTWYNSYIPSDTGIDGAKQIIKFFKIINEINVRNIVMPLISLCDTEKIKNIIRKNKFKVTILLDKDWPIPNNLIINERDSLMKLKRRKKIYFKEKYGFFVANTKILHLQKN